MIKEVGKEFAKMVLSFIKDNTEFMSKVEEFMKSHKECWDTCSNGHSQLNSLDIGINYHDDNINKAKPWFSVRLGSISTEAFEYIDFNNMTTATLWKGEKIQEEETVFIKQDDQQQELSIGQD